MNRHYEVDITRSTSSFRGNIFICATSKERRACICCEPHIYACVAAHRAKKMCIWKQSRWSLVRFIRAVCFEHIKYSLHTEEFQSLVMPVIHIHLLHTVADNQTERKTNRARSYKYITCGLPLPFGWLWYLLLFSLLPLFPSTFSPQSCYSQFPCPFGDHFLSFPLVRAQPLFLFWRQGVLC